MFLYGFYCSENIDSPNKGSQARRKTTSPADFIEKNRVELPQMTFSISAMHCNQTRNFCGGNFSKNAPPVYGTPIFSRFWK